MKSKNPPDNPDDNCISKLAEDKKETLLRSAEEITRGRTLTSICVYGSRVAGYAKPDSDYDIIIVIPEYPPKVRYVYIKEDLDVAALLVDKNALTADAEKGALGEFVIGRLLNPYEILDESDYLKEVEVKYKKRVIAEILNEIVFTYGEFSSSITIPIEYFLYEKLKKRATIYPPALYSYTKTYLGEQAKANLKSTLQGFRAALYTLHDEGLISIEGDEIKIKTTTLNRRQLARLKSVMTHTARGLRQYAVHGYAGRVGWKVVGKEALSKIGRSKEVCDVPIKLRNPKKLWRIDEGLLIPEGDNWLYQIAEYLGCGRNVRIHHRHLGEFYNITRVYFLENEDRSVTLAVKKFKDLRSLKWSILNLWALPARRFYTSPLSRLHKEYTAIRTLREMGLYTPKIIAVALQDAILITEFIDGVNLSRIITDILQNKSEELDAVYLYGQTLGEAHSRGYTLGDTKPSNAIYFNSKIYLTDLEQSGIGGDPSWDLTEFLYYSAKLTYNINKVNKITQYFLNGYLKLGSKSTIEKALNIKYLTPFQPLLARSVLKSIREEMAYIAGVQAK